MNNSNENLLKALLICTKKPKKNDGQTAFQGICIDVKRGFICASDGHILLKIERSKDDINSFMQYIANKNGIPCPEFDENDDIIVAYADSKNRPKGYTIFSTSKTGYLGTYPDVIKIIPTEFENKGVRPSFSFDGLEKCHKVYKALEISVIGWYGFGYNTPTTATVQTYPDVLILLMPIRVFE